MGTIGGCWAHKGLLGSLGLEGSPFSMPVTVVPLLQLLALQEAQSHELKRRPRSSSALDRPRVVW